MGIHLAAECFKIEGFFGCHINPEYSVIGLSISSFSARTAPPPFSAEPRVKVCQQRGHLLVIESSGKTRHHPLPGKYVLPHRRVRCWDAAGQSVLIEEPMQILRHFLQGQIVILVAMGAAHMVK